MEKRFPFLIGLIIILVLIGSQSIFIVNQTEKALVIQLGDPVDKVFGPGLHFKIPLIQTVVRFDARVLRSLADHRSLAVLQIGAHDPGSPGPS